MKQSLLVMMALLFLCCLSSLIVADENDFHQRVIEPSSINHTDGGHLKCGLPYTLDAIHSDNKPALQYLAEQRRQRHAKKMLIYTSPSGFFEIHYDTSGFNAIPDYDRDNNGIPDYLEFVGNAFDRAFDREILDLGYRLPPDVNGASRTTYPVFCERMSSGLYGRTDLLDEIPSLAGLNYVSEIVISTDFGFVQYPDITSDPIVRDSLAIEVTAAHEFNHASQLGYRIWLNEANTFFLDIWFLESTATFMEEVVAPEVNDYLQYLPNLLQSTAQNMADQSNVSRIYGSSIFYMMLQDEFGDTIAREFWDEVLNQPPLGAVNAVLQQSGSSFGEKWHQLAQWLFFSGSRSVAGQFFEDANLFPTPFAMTTDAFSGLSGAQTEIASGELQPLSFQYWETPISASGNFSLDLAPSGNDDEWLGAYLDLTSNSGRNFRVGQLRAIRDNTNAFYVISRGTGSGDNRAETGAFYQVFMTESAFSAGPNIIRPEDGRNQITFYNIPDEARIEIFTSNGIPIRSLEKIPGADPVWDLLTSQQEPVGSGVYIYSVLWSGNVETGKIMVIR